MVNPTFTPSIHPWRSPEQHEEHQYLNMIRYIMDHGEFRADRTGTGTRSIFAPPAMRFSLEDDIFPLLTTKRVFFRAVVEELLWFVKGDTNGLHLSEKGIKIWDGNGSREYLDKIGLPHRKVGDLGPVYGFQWRHFGAEYKDCDTDYTGQGVDQLAEVIWKIKNNPTDRRIVLNAWNPADLGKMALPPCHMFCQFYVSTPTEEQPRAKLSCQLYQRSCDMGLGVPFNIASYALLTKMIAYVTDLDCGEFIHTMGDSHIYLDHTEALKVQIEREPRPFPKLYIRPLQGGDEEGSAETRRAIHNIDEFKLEDFVLEGYNPHKKLDMVIIQGRHIEAENEGLFQEEYERAEQEDEAYTQDRLAHENDDDQAEVEPQGSTTSARLRMHHEMVQQMRVRAGFAPEPFPGDADGVEGDEGEDGEEEGEDDGGVGPSSGATLTAGRIKKIGKKRAEKLQRKEQMRAYREFMAAQQEERRQQEELFQMQEAAQQEERRRKRSEQIEKDRKRKEQLKEKEAKENDSKMKRIHSERLRDEKARRELRAYIQRVKSFRLSALAKKLGRTEAQLLGDLTAVAQDDDLRSASNQALGAGVTVPRISLASSLARPSPPSSLAGHSSSSHTESVRPQFLVLYDSASDLYVILDEAKLSAFTDVVKSKGRVDKKELSLASESILQPCNQ
ncbi:Thymidylate synthase [Entomortierella chlamydospora]|uniref:thymidylate synthase n=1 Tax=Entomortierella chlamydospora TaxID=101097 RepID=A0A9P6T039_9FUNG|nr:Thymidylate synthase [Entomortierella chlamydospora]